VDGTRETGERLEYLDALRGCAVFLMIFVNFVEQYARIPSWTKHAPGNGFTYVDGIAPMFVFAMGMSGALSLSRRLSSGGLGKTVRHALVRYGALFLFGTIGSVLLFLANRELEWNIFQTLAVAGLAAFPIFFLRSPRLRLAVALALMALYQLALALWLKDAIFLREPPIPFLPSAVGSLALATVVVFGSGCAGWSSRHTPAAAAIAAAASLALGLGLSPLVAPNRPMGSITYLFFGIAMAEGFLFLFYFAARWLKRISLFPTLGKNALVIFMIASVLTKVLNELLPEATGVAIVLPTAAALEAACIAAAWLLKRKKIFIKL
jgi:uncharacterized membrane protein